MEENIDTEVCYRWTHKVYLLVTSGKKLHVLITLNEVLSMPLDTMLRNQCVSEVMTSIVLVNK